MATTPHHFIFDCRRKIETTELKQIKLRIEAGNVSKRQKNYQGADIIFVLSTEADFAKYNLCNEVNATNNNDDMEKHHSANY